MTAGSGEAARSVVAESEHRARAIERAIGRVFIILILCSFEWGKLSGNYFDEYGAFEEKSLSLSIIDQRSLRTRMEMVHGPRRVAIQCGAAVVDFDPLEELFIQSFQLETPFGWGFAQRPGYDEIEPFRIHQPGCFGARRLPKGRVPTQNSLDTSLKL